MRKNAAKKVTKKTAKKSAPKKTVENQNEKSKQDILDNIVGNIVEAPDYSNVETKELSVEILERLEGEVREFKEDVEDLIEDVIEDIKEIPQKVKDAFKRFIDIYSPPVITEENAKLEEKNGKYKIVVNCAEKGIEGSMPKFIDSLEVEIKK